MAQSGKGTGGNLVTPNSHMLETILSRFTMIHQTSPPGRGYRLNWQTIIRYLMRTEIKLMYFASQVWYPNLTWNYHSTCCPKCKDLKSCNKVDYHYIFKKLNSMNPPIYKAVNRRVGCAPVSGQRGSSKEFIAQSAFFHSSDITEHWLSVCVPGKGDSSDQM